MYEPHNIVLFESFEGKCEVTFYKEHYGHKEIELQHIKIPDIKKHEIAAKLSQGVTFKRILDDVRENIGNSLKREDLITRSDLHNIKQKNNLNLKMVNSIRVMPQVLTYGLNK